MPKAALRKAATSAAPVAITPTRAQPDREAGRADHGEDQADQLGELQRRHRLTLADRRQARGHQFGEHQSVGVATRARRGADREDDGLQAQDERGGQRADARDEEGDHQHGGGDPGGESGTANIDLVRWCWYST